ncbi:hypothetical protein P4B35_10190 [Pontiellaceae bacterium B12227]|nr:hypothetical protein [Pontiellaceae bacterium B12227]
MIQFHSKRYHHPRWPLVKNTISCALWILIGSGISISPIGHFRWIGLAPLAYGFGRWIFSTRPRWKHVVILNESQLKIGDRHYDWNRFDEMRLDRTASSRTIHLTGNDGKLDILIKDDLPGFDELARDCFYHMNRTFGQSASGICDSKSTPNSLK